MVNRNRATLEERFWAKVEKGAGCWEWTGARTQTGYGLFWAGGHGQGAHRFAYEWMRGPIPEGLQLDHLCRNKSCVNPAHLEPVTPKENTQRDRDSRTRCPAGHPYDEANTYRNPRTGNRCCRACKAAGARAAYRPRPRKPKTHCPHGHVFDEPNTYLYRGKMHCRACATARAREWKRAHRKAS